MYRKCLPVLLASNSTCKLNKNPLASLNSRPAGLAWRRSADCLQQIFDAHLFDARTDLQ